jgi:1-acyl-sn-glycerol-3-phosphate acyltransferase
MTAQAKEPFGAVYRLFILAASGVVRLCWIGRIEGMETVPPGPCIFVSNHASYLDFVILSYLFYHVQCRVVHFWAKTKMVRHPFWCVFSWMFKALEVGDAVSCRGLLTTSAACLQRGESICIYPEGTRTRTGQILEFKTGYLRLARATGAPVVCLLLENTCETWPADRWLPRLRRCHIRLVGVYALAPGATKGELVCLNAAIREDLAAAAGRGRHP